MSSFERFVRSGRAKEQSFSALALCDAHVGIVADIGAVNLELGVHDRTTLSEEIGLAVESGFLKLRFELLKSVDQQTFSPDPHFFLRLCTLTPILFIHSFQARGQIYQLDVDNRIREDCNCVQRHCRCKRSDFRAGFGVFHWMLVGADKRDRVVDEQVRVHLHGAHQRIHHGRRLLKHVCRVVGQLLPEQLRGIAVLDCEVCCRRPPKIGVDRRSRLADFP